MLYDEDDVGVIMN